MPDMHFQYLYIEICRIDVLIRKMVVLWNLAGQDSADRFRGLYIPQEEALKISKQQPGSNWGSDAQLPTADRQAFTREYAQLVCDAERLTASGFIPRLLLLAQQFHLSLFEYNAFLVCLAPALDLRYEKIYGFLQNDVTRRLPSVSLILDILEVDGDDRLTCQQVFTSEANLLKFGLIVHPENDPVQPDSILKTEFIAAPEIVQWLTGAYLSHDDLMDCLELDAHPTVTDPDVVPHEISAIQLDSITQNQPILAMHGPDLRQQTESARFICASLQRPMLRIDLDRLKIGAGITPQNLDRCLRDAALTGSIPFFTGWDCLFKEDKFGLTYLLQKLMEYPSPVITSGDAAWRIPADIGGQHKPVFSFLFTHPSAAQRLHLWRQTLGDANQEEESVLDALAGQFTLTSAQIHSAVATARDQALQQNRPVNRADLFEAARQNSSHTLDQLAVKIQPRYNWQDIILPADEMSVLREIASTVRDRALVLETWGLGRKLVATAGISALFAGEPGTGKTLAAQVIASELGMDLYKIDLSTIVSKYVGETEKNLEQIFSQARNSNAILFFDEADAIFGKRSEVKDAHDRYANIEVGYLLQRMESYDGIVILATNLRSNMDDAFTRRLQFVVDFPFPDAAQRLEIWKVLFPPGVPCDEHIDFETLSGRFHLAGGSIRNIIVSASFLAASEGTAVSMRHLIHGVRRELKKMGRLINEKDLVIV